MHTKGHKTNDYVLWLIEFIMNWISPIIEHGFDKPTNSWTNCNTNLRYIVTLHISTHLYHRRLTKTNWEITKFFKSCTPQPTQLPNFFLLISTLFLFPIHSCCRPAACCWFRCYSAYVCLSEGFITTSTVCMLFYYDRSAMASSELHERSIFVGVNIFEHCHLIIVEPLGWNYISKLHKHTKETLKRWHTHSLDKTDIYTQKHPTTYFLNIEHRTVSRFFIFTP